MTLRMSNQQAGNERRAAEAAMVWDRRAEMIRRRYTQENWSQQRLADHYGVTLAAMQKVMARLGIASRSRGRTGPENGRFVDGSKSTAYRALIKKSACAECGTQSQLVIHHKDHNHMNNAPENLEVLCSPCHTRHHKREYWRRRKAGQS